jgi:hypothetical protein
MWKFITFSTIYMIVNFWQVSTYTDLNEQIHKYSYQFMTAKWYYIKWYLPLVKWKSRKYKKDNFYSSQNVVNTNSYFLLTYSIPVHQHEYVVVLRRRATDKQKSGTFGSSILFWEFFRRIILYTNQNYRSSWVLCFLSWGRFLFNDQFMLWWELDRELENS